MLLQFLQIARGPVWGLDLVGFAILIVIVAAVIALVVIGVRAMGLTIPAWATQVFWIVIIAFVVILAIKALASM